MGGCLGKSSSAGHRVSGDTGGGAGDERSRLRVDANDKEEREKRAAAAEARLTASGRRGTHGGDLEKKLEREKAAPKATPPELGGGENKMTWTVS